MSLNPFPMPGLDGNWMNEKGTAPAVDTMILSDRYVGRTARLICPARSEV